VNVREKVSHRPLRAGLSLSFDFGCVLDDYCSDFGRTITYRRALRRVSRAYDLVIAAHDQAIVA